MFSRTYRGARGFVLRGGLPSSFTPPAEWGGLTPVRDWDMANAVLSGSDITSVPNHSQLSVAALTGAASNLPTIVASSAHFNSHPSAAITGTLRFTHGGLGVGADTGTLIVVCKRLVDGGVFNQFVWRFNNDHVAIYAPTGTSGWRAWHDSAAGVVNSNNSQSDATVIMTTLTGGTQRLYTNSATEEANAASSGCTYSGNGMVGNLHSGVNSIWSLDGEIARILVFDVVPSAGQRAAILAALGSKYGITIS